MDWLWGVSAAALAYTAGSVPVAYLVSRWMRGVDIRAVGSGNVGAANAIRSVGLVPGLIILAIDVGKGALAVLVPMALGASEWLTYAVVVALVVGYNWSLFLGLQGGRGAAPVFGISMVVLPLLTLASVAPVVLVLWQTRNIVPAVVAGFLALNTLTVLTGQPLEQVLLCMTLTLVPLAAHLQRTGPRLLAAVRGRRWALLLSIE